MSIQVLLIESTRSCSMYPLRLHFSAKDIFSSTLSYMGANPPPILRLEPWIRSWWFENTSTTMRTFLQNHIVVLMAQCLRVKVL